MSDSVSLNPEAENEIELDRMANVDADIAFLDAQKGGATQAECVKAAIRAYVESDKNAEANSQVRADQGNLSISPPAASAADRSGKAETSEHAEKRNREARVMLTMLCDVVSRVPLEDDSPLAAELRWDLIRARDAAIVYMEIDR